MAAFTLGELLVTLAVLAVIVLLFTQVLNSAAKITTLGHRQMDADSQARQLLDRMAVDFAQIVKRPDVDYFLKSTTAGAPDCTTCGAQPGNDRIAFFAATSGYYPTPSYQSPVSLVAYRINSGSTNSSYNKMERMGKGFIWNGVSSSYKPILFLNSPTAPTTTISSQWSAAVSSSATDSDYEVIGPQIFRFEYYYLLKNGTFSNRPWVSPNTSVNGMQDVAAIVADIAVIDPKSKVLLSDAQITTLIGGLADYTTSMGAGGLRANWQTYLDGITTLPRTAISGIRLYERFFYLSK